MRDEMDETTAELSRLGMTADELARVQVQADLLRADHQFVTTVYDVMFSEYPELRSMFPEDLGAQRARFAEEFAVLMDGLLDLEAFERRGRDLGRRHAARGVRAEHYPKVRDAFVTAVAVHLGEELSAADRVAWTRAFDLIGAVMQKGAEEAATP